jgi:two-component system, OmpR family, alkaline phosphatase synthesis response regulator PhoP
MTRTAHNKILIKILIVDDDADILHLVALYLEKEGFRVVTARTGTQALTLLKANQPDLIILDLMLPGMSGLEVCKKIRLNPDTAMISVLMLTAKADESDIVIGLELGADDYVTKPFSPKALVARVKTMLRRTYRSASEAQSIHRYGAVVMDFSRHEVKVGDREIPLTPREFGLLEHLVRNVGRVQTRDVLLNAVWGYGYYGTTRTVDVHVRKLKQKIPLLHEAIVAVKTLGYTLREANSSVSM